MRRFALAISTINTLFLAKTHNGQGGLTMASKILEEARDVMRRRHYSIHTERTYCDWIKRYIQHFNMQSRSDLADGERKVEEYLTFLARDKQVAPSTQNQAMNALVFFYKQVLKQPFTEAINAERAPRRVKVPVVLTREETSRLLDAMSGPHQLTVKLLYGCGLRISECVRLRVQDVDLNRATPYFLRKLSALRFGT
jgi:integrase